MAVPDAFEVIVPPAVMDPLGAEKASPDPTFEVIFPPAVILP